MSTDAATDAAPTTVALRLEVALLPVADVDRAIEAAREELLGRAVEVSEVWHGRGLGSEGHEPGRAPDGASYGSFASFSDPDGNRWLLQEIKQRIPGRVW